tara:strand:+ start:717 stop:1382 length:666 start_codon:yes stop_codon:yes gene_type:complete
MKARISEIFKSIQGEGLHQGQSQVFVRFFGCSFECKYCDTKLDAYHEYTAEEILAQINTYPESRCLSITGGEPLEQVDFLIDFFKSLKKLGKTIHLETNGILYRNLAKVIDLIEVIAMDFKLSSSTGMKDYWYPHREFLKVAIAKDVFVKAVITNATLTDDIRIAAAVIKEVKRDTVLILQPENPFEDELKRKLEYFKKICQEVAIDVRILPQLHKRLGVK